VRFRKDGFSIYIAGTPWSEDFMRDYAAALEGLKPTTGTIGAERTKPGTINALIVSYYALVFPTLEPSTQRMRRNILERFRREHGDRPVDRIEHEHVAAIIAAKANTPEAGNNLRKVLRHLFEHAVAIRMIKANPAQYVKKFKSTGDGIHTWSEDEVARFIKCHPLGTKAHLALMLMLYTGQRGRSDAARTGWQHVSGKGGDKITVRQKKTDTPLLIPIPPALMQALEALPRSNMTFLVTERGAPFTGPGFGNWFRDQWSAQARSHAARRSRMLRARDHGDHRSTSRSVRYRATPRRRSSRGSPIRR
jgi:hypothetical protein